MGKKPLYASDIEAARYAPPPQPTFHLHQPSQWFPWLVPLIFLANVAMFVYSMYVNDCPAYLRGGGCLYYEHLGRFSFQPFTENPLLGPSIRTPTKVYPVGKNSTLTSYKDLSSTLTANVRAIFVGNMLRLLGALERDLVVGDNETWRFFTCMFLHAGVIHLLANMFSLLFIGVRLEKESGFMRIGILYLLSGFGGSILSLLDLRQSGSSHTISVGASGALFGLLGAMPSEILTNWTIYANKCAALTSLLIIIGINLAVGFLPHVDNSAHIGGFLSGFFLGFVLLMRPQYGYVNRKYIPPGYDAKHKSKYGCYQYVFLGMSVVILLIAYAVGLAKLYIETPQYKLPFPKRNPS